MSCRFRFRCRNSKSDDNRPVLSFCAVCYTVSMANKEDVGELPEQAESVIKEFFEKTNLKKGALVVAGCSTSEIAGKKIGSSSSEETGKAVFDALYKICKKHGVFLACQCCEHLNRALCVERECAEKFNLEEVSVVPYVKAGGAFASAAYRSYKDPVMVEEVQADAGLDIGSTLIGMHLKRVAVPFRLEHNQIGEAKVICAYTRPKLIGGERAHYSL